MPPAHPSGIPHGCLGPCCASACSKLSLGPFYLGTNPLAFPAWPCAAPCKWTKGSFHQPAAVGTPPGCRDITHAPQNISAGGEKPTAPAGFLSLLGTHIAPARVLLTQWGTLSVSVPPGARAAMHVPRIAGMDFGYVRSVFTVSLLPPRISTLALTSATWRGEQTGRLPTKMSDIMVSFASNTASSLPQ